MTIKLIKVKHTYSDDRGFIAPLVDEDNFKVKNVLYLFSKAGAIRGNHYHKKESYWEYCIKGSFRYVEKDIKKPHSKLKSIIVHDGEMIYSPAGIAHAMEILEDTISLAITSRSRKQKSYEADLVRIKII